MRDLAKLCGATACTPRGRGEDRADMAHAGEAEAAGAIGVDGMPAGDEAVAHAGARSRLRLRRRVSASAGLSNTSARTPR